jgi:hypothetical protein
MSRMSDLFIDIENELVNGATVDECVRMFEVDAEDVLAVLDSIMEDDYENVDIDMNDLDYLVEESYSQVNDYIFD